MCTSTSLSATKSSSFFMRNLKAVEMSGSSFPYYLLLFFYRLHLPHYLSLPCSSIFISVPNPCHPFSCPAPAPYLAEAMIWCLASLTSLSHLAHTMAGPPGEGQHEEVQEGEQGTGGAQDLGRHAISEDVTHVAPYNIGRNIAVFFLNHTKSTGSLL